MTQHPLLSAEIVGADRYRRRIIEWLSAQPIITHVTDVRENQPGAGLFTGLAVVADLDDAAHATEVEDLIGQWVRWRGTKAWTLSLSSRVAVVVAPAANPLGVGAAWAALMADERIEHGSALSPRVDAPGATFVLRTPGAALPVLWSHVNAAHGDRYRPRRAVVPTEPERQTVALTFNVEVEGRDASYWLSGSPDLLLASRPALERLTAVASGSRISGIFHGDDFAVVTVWSRSHETAAAVERAWSVAGAPDVVELRFEQSCS